MDGWEGSFLSAEAIAVFKLLYFRLKDRVDLERLVAWDALCARALSSESV